MDFAGQWGPEPFIDRAGNKRSSSVVVVYETDGSTIADLWTDRSRETELSNPLPTGVPIGEPGLDGQANGMFWAVPGAYVLAVVYEDVEVYRSEITVDPDPDEIESGLVGSVDALATERAERIVADIALDTGKASIVALGVEATERTDADDALADDIATEADARAAADDLLIPLSQKGAADGVPTLGPDGKLPSAQVPAVAISTFLGEVASEPAMLALVGETGDWCIRTDLTAAFLLLTDDPTQAANWKRLPTPADAVISVNEQTGIVVIPSDAAAAVASLRTLGTGATQALPGNTPVATTADLAAETTARTTADNLRQLLSGKGAASGYMGLDAGSRGAQPPKLHAAAHVPGGDDEIFALFGSLTANRVETAPRLCAAGISPIAAGTVYLSYFTAAYDRLLTQLTIVNGSTGAVGATLVRLGLLTVDGSEDLTLVARTANDTTLLASPNTVYGRVLDTAGGFPANYQITRGVRYAMALVVVGATVQPNPIHVLGAALGSVFATQTPRVAAALSGQADIPASIPAGSLTLASGVRAYWMAGS